MAHSTWGLNVAGKLCDASLTCAIPERLRYDYHNKVLHKAMGLLYEYFTKASKKSKVQKLLEQVFLCDESSVLVGTLSRTVWTGTLP